MLYEDMYQLFLHRYSFVIRGIVSSSRIIDPTARITASLSSFLASVHLVLL